MVLFEVVDFRLRKRREASVAETVDERLRLVASCE